MTEHVNYIVANYLKILGFDDSVVLQMNRFLENHFAYPSLRSISDAFDEWQINNYALRVSPEQLRDCGDFFIAHMDIDEGYFVLVLNVTDDSVTYLHANGEAVNEPLADFCGKWKEIIFVAEPTPASGIKIDRGPEKRDPASLKDIKKIAYNQEEPFTYKMFRPLSVLLSYVFVRLGLKPNFITFCWLLCLLGASVLFSFGSYAYNLVAVGLIALHFMLDCADGEVARATGQTSRIGSVFEQFVHWLTNLTLIAGITMGLFNQTNSGDVLVLGMICILCDACFHYIYIQFNFWMDKSVDYGFFHHITRALYYFMPLNINIYIIGALFNVQYYALLAWACIAAALFIVLAVLFFKKEFSLLQK